MIISKRNTPIFLQVLNIMYFEVIFMPKKRRYFLPGLFTIGGIGAALIALYLNTIGESAFGIFTIFPFLTVDSL